MCQLRLVCVTLGTKPVIVVICSSSAQDSFARFFLEGRGFLLCRRVWVLGRSTAVVFTLACLNLLLVIQWSAQDSFKWSGAFFWRSPKNLLFRRTALLYRRVTLALYGSADILTRKLCEQCIGMRSSTVIRMQVVGWIRLRLIALVLFSQEGGE